MAKQRRWTLPEIREAHRRNLEGETIPDIAAGMGVTEWSLRMAIRRSINEPGPGSGCGRGCPKPQPWRLPFYREALALRGTTELSWPEIAARVEWPLSTRKLRDGVHRYAKRAEIKVRTVSAPPLVVRAYTHPSVCRIESCRRPPRNRGMCNRCRQQAMRQGVLDEVAAPSRQGQHP